MAIDEQGKPDLDELKQTVVARLDTLSRKSSAVSGELAELVAAIREAVEDDDGERQKALTGEVEEWLKGDLELREDIRNALHLFYLYVHLRDGYGLQEEGPLVCL